MKISEYVIKNIEHHVKGRVSTIDIRGKEVKVVFTYHCLDRLEFWKIDQFSLFKALIEPEEVLKGHGNRYIAHRRFDDHLIRAIYDYEDDLPIVITVYFPYTSRYFHGGKIYEDKIFS